MPTPKFFKKFSKESPQDSPDASPDATPATHSREDPSETPAIADPDVPQYSDAIKEAWNAANAELPQAHGVEKFLNRVGTSIVSVPQRLPADVCEETVQNVVTLSAGQQAVVDTLAAPAKALVDTPQIADTIEKGINAFMEAVPVLMKALDEVAKVHPFISGMIKSASGAGALTDDFLVAVLAFKAVYTLELKRRSNDKRVIALYVEYVACDLSR